MFVVRHELINRIIVSSDMWSDLIIYPAISHYHFLPARRLLARYLLQQRGWLDATCRYCIKTAKPILKLFRTSGSVFILVSFDPCVDTQFQREPFSGGYIYTGGGWEKLAIFDGNPRLSRKQCETGRSLLWNVNRKSWVADWMVSFWMTLSDP